jgi:palmitoyltransferase
MTDQIPRRRNGFTAPYNMPQIYAWLALLLTLLHFCLGVAPLFPLSAALPLLAFFLFLFGLVLCYGMRAIAVDSMDVFLGEHLRSIRNGRIATESPWSDGVYEAYNPPRTAPATVDPEHMKQCWICDVQVAESSMHCKYCNKCVGKFDHHCMWLNTCVGERNYEDFFRVMLAIFAMQVLHLSTSLALCIDIFLDGPTHGRAENWIGPTASNALLIFFMAFDGVSLVLLVQLVWFHLGLQRQNLTTYQYIVLDHKQRRDRGKLEQALEHQREVAIAKARAEGRTMDRFKLACGEEWRRNGCAYCDPLDLPTEVPDEGFAASFGLTPGGSFDDPEALFEELDEENVADVEEAVVTEQSRSTSPNNEADDDDAAGVTFVAVNDAAQGDDILAEPGADTGSTSEHPIDLVEPLVSADIDGAAVLAEDDTNGIADAPHDELRASTPTTDTPKGAWEIPPQAQSP